MKTRNFITTIAIAAAVFTSCSDELFQEPDFSVETKSTFISEECTDSIFVTTVNDLSEGDVDGLMLMREEEKLAHDVYAYFYEKYSLPIFENIAASEAKHAESVLALLIHFELEDPTLAEAGTFANEELQILYNELIAMGEESVEAALTVGALIEETDIEDLNLLLAATSNSDIITVYSNLLKGSYNHLKGFVRNLTNYDIEYQTTILTEEEFDAILASTGNGNEGNGNGAKGNQDGNGNGSGNNGNGNQNGNGSNNNGNGNQGGNDKGNNSGNKGEGSGDGTGDCIEE